MAQDWWHYDPTVDALIHPEKRHPHGLWLDDAASWPEDAIIAEFARLAYFPFDSAGKARLSEALNAAGFGPPECWNSTVPTFGPLWTRAIQWLRDRNAQAFGATSRDGETTIIAFRGTQPNQPMDLILDLEFLPVRWSQSGQEPRPGKVHEGFWKAYESLAGEIGSWLRAGRHRRLIITGHSLGAAMATIMAAAYLDARLVTFGSPMVGNEEFGRAFRGRSPVRYVDCADLVSLLPLEPLGYVHVGTLRYIDRNGVVHASPVPAEIRADRARAREDYPGRYLSPDNVLSRDLADHAPVNYVSALAGRRQ